MSTCNMFATFTYSLSRYLVTSDPDLVQSVNATIDAQMHASQGHRHAVFDPQRLEKMFDMLTKYEDSFTRHLKILLDTLNYLAATETVVFLQLCARLTSASEGLSGFQVPTGIENMV
jgi:gamma-tubulin complex component 2